MTSSIKLLISQKSILIVIYDNNMILNNNLFNYYNSVMLYKLININTTDQICHIRVKNIIIKWNHQQPDFITTLISGLQI